MTALVVMSIVFAVSVVMSIRLAMFISACDQREADAQLVHEAERIVRESAGRR